MRLLLSTFVIAGCSSAAPPPTQPTSPPPADAAPETVDAPPARPDITIETKPYAFRFASAARTETWTLWFGKGLAVLNVQPAGGTVTQYQGSATEGDTIAIDVAGPTAKMKLECKPTKRELDAACDPSAPKPKTKAKPKKVTVDALDCFHADFKEPMPFGPLPGIEYAADGACAGYHVIP